VGVASHVHIIRKGRFIMKFWNVWFVRRKYQLYYHPVRAVVAQLYLWSLRRRVNPIRVGRRLHHFMGLKGWK